MKKCVVCRTEEQSIREICSICANKLPDVTVKAYQKSMISTARLVEVVMLRSKSVKELRGGRHTPER